MAANENKDLVRRYLAEVSGKDKPAEMLDKYVADEELKQHIAVFEAAFPRYELIADDVFAEGDRVAVRGTVRGHHTGELMGIPPTGKTVSLTVLLIYRLADGKIVDHWMSVDRLELLEQLGVAPATGAGAR
jgi:predicted ester cyclase